MKVTLLVQLCLGLMENEAIYNIWPLQKRRSGIGSELLFRCVYALSAQSILKSHIHVLSNNDLAKYTGRIVAG